MAEGHFDHLRPRPISRARRTSLMSVCCAGMTVAAAAVTSLASEDARSTTTRESGSLKPIRGGGASVAFGVRTRPAIPFGGTSR